MIKESYFGVNGERVKSTALYAEVRKTYNDLNQVIHEAWFDENLNPCALKNTYAAIDREYDEFGNVSFE